MAHIKALVTLGMVSGIAEDASVNTFHFTGDPLDDRSDIADAIVAAYNELNGDFSGLVHQNLINIKLYNMGDLTPRFPIWDDTYDFTSTPGGDSLPPEVTICLSFHGAFASGEPPARRKGRVYFGPLDKAAADSDGRPTTTLLDHVKNFGNSLRSAATSSAAWSWDVYSPTADESFPIVGGWVDDAFDTQRRRGVSPVAKSLWT